MPSLSLVSERSTADRFSERSEAARDILGRVPHWTLRYGLGGLAAVFVLALTLLWLMRYPDVLIGRATLTNLHPPSPIHANSAGQIARFLVSDGQDVRAGDTLALLHSSADPAAIEALKVWLDSLPSDLNGPLSAEVAPPPANLELGDVLPSYAAFKRALDDHRYFQLLDPLQVESAPLQQEILQTTVLLSARHAQLDALDQEVALLRKSRERVAVLAADGLVSRDSLTQSDREIARAIYTREATVADIAATQVDLARLERQLRQLQMSYAQTARDRQSRLEEARRQLTGAYAEWTHRYRIDAPHAGRVSVNRVWSANQFVNNGEELLTLIADADQAVFGRIDLPVDGSGKVSIGDRVMLRLDPYPYDEFGAVEATITSIDDIPRNGSYRMHASLNQGLITTAGKTIPAAAELHGEARVVTQDRRLLGRLFGRLGSHN